jgi:hypothetical protein
MKKTLQTAAALVVACLVTLPVAAKVTYADIVAADKPKRDADLAAYYAHKAQDKALKATINPTQEGGWKTLYTGNTTSAITVPSGVANLYVTTTTGQSYFIPVVAPASNFASLKASGGYVYARWTGTAIKGERKVISYEQCTSIPSKGEQNRPDSCKTISNTYTIGITRVMTQ